MMKEWTDQLPERAAADVWHRQTEAVRARRLGVIEGDLSAAVTAGAQMNGFYEAMRNFLALRDRLFPDLPGDPAWKILVTLALTPDGSAKANVSGICYGADVPMTTALRYIAVMEEQGIIERVPHPNDGRQVMLRLTVEGKRRMQVIADKWVMRLSWMLAPIAALMAAAIGGSVV